MDFPKIIITTKEEIFKELIDKFSFVLLKREGDTSIYKPWISKENILLVFSDNKLVESTEYIFNNYLFEELIYLWTAKRLSNMDIKDWDVIIPNTFITDSSDFAIFNTNTIWENYDFKKFGLLLSWVSLTSYKNIKWANTDFAADIIDDEVYDFVKLLKDKEELERVNILKIIYSQNNPELIKNAISVIDFFLE